MHQLTSSVCEFSVPSPVKQLQNNDYKCKNNKGINERLTKN